MIKREMVQASLCCAYVFVDAARDSANRSAAEIIRLLDTSEYLIALIREDTDQTDRFRSYAASECRRMPSLFPAMAALSCDDPKQWYAEHFEKSRIEGSAATHCQLTSGAVIEPSTLDVSLPIIHRALVRGRTSYCLGQEIPETSRILEVVGRLILIVADGAGDLGRFRDCISEAVVDLPSMSCALRWFDMGGAPTSSRTRRQEPKTRSDWSESAGKFEKLLDSGAELTPIQRIRFIEAGLVDALRTSNLHYWRPGDSIPNSGRRVLIGALVFSPGDMRVLDVLDTTLPKQREEIVDRLDVFSLSEVPEAEGLRSYFPGFEGRTLSPLVGVWIDGVKEEYACGRRAYDVLIELYPQLKGVRV